MLRRLLNNLAGQTEALKEHIIVDAEDGAESREISISYRNTKIIPGPDRNSHHAMNKGIAAATGDIIGFINTDDSLYPGALALVQEHFARNPGCMMLRIGCHLAPFGTHAGAEPLQLLYPGASVALLPLLLFGTPGFNTWFFRRDFLLRHGSLPDGGVFDERYVVAADRDLLLRLYLAGFRPEYLPQAIYVYGLHDESATLDAAGRGAEAILQEHRAIATHLLGHAGASAAALAAWHARETLILARIYWRSGRRSDALALLAGAWLSAPAFPLRLLRARDLRRSLIAALAWTLGEGGISVPRAF